MLGKMMKRISILAFWGGPALLLSGCGQEVVAPSSSTSSSIPAEAAPSAHRPALSRMSRKQREVFRIQETANHLGEALGVFKQLEAAGGLKLALGASPELAAMENTFASIRQEAQVEVTESAAGYPHRSGGKLDVLFTQVLALEKLMLWPEDSPERKRVAASLVAASEVFEAAVPLNRAGAETAPGKGR
jgi:hypothetical protein